MPKALKEIEQEIRALSGEEKIELLLEHPEIDARVDDNLRYFVRAQIHWYEATGIRRKILADSGVACFE